ncbi:MAG: hypothetical protein FWD69_02305 [Polyangiaceae bacterium]|nr:hypothetical protein [Polyangiaceae bacterium]
MRKRHLPSIETLTSSDNERLNAELRLSEVRDQVTHAKELLDAVELYVLPHSDTQPQDEFAVVPAVAEELARLGCRIVEIASVLSKAQELTPRSASHPRDQRAAPPP